MYMPQAFSETDPSVWSELIGAHAFATLITYDPRSAAPYATHLPFLYDAARGPLGTLYGHVARANAQWTHGDSALAVFLGAHAYVSPRWYAAEFAVPTWNYEAVHAYGRLTLLSEAQAVHEVLDRFVARYEAGRPNPWSVPWADERYGKLLDALVAFELPVERIECKRKLSQNRTPADQWGVIEALCASGGPDDRALAERMKRTAPPRP